MSKERSNKISIYLIKKDIAYEEILKECAYKNKLLELDNSITFFLPTTSKQPDWLINYFKKDDASLKISNSHSKVISLHKIVIDGEERIFAIPFGNGKILLNDDVIEEQFGIKVLLNSVEKDGFRKLSIANYGSDHRTKNEQTPKKTDISEFGFDIYNDFVRRATAKSEEKIFNKNTITGGDLFSVSVPVNIENVDDFLMFCYRRYKSDKYKKHFSWLDNIKEVREKGLKEKLNNELVNQINQHNYNDIWLAVPEVVEWEKIKDFRFRRSEVGSDDIELEDYVNMLSPKNISSVEMLKRSKVYAMSTETDEELYNWTVYNCLIGEIQYDGNIYCLNFGKWYKVNNDFVTTVNDYYEKISICSKSFIDCNNGEKEGDYNKRLSDSFDNSVLFDTQTVQQSGMGKSSIEVCDVLTKDNELIHVKKNGSSSNLSHLFFQASVSGDALLDRRFREAANDKIGKAVFNDDYIASDYKIILAIITKERGDRPKIPFFSKVSIQYAIDGLVAKGYSVELKNIYMEGKC